jgi:cobalt-zinc-cadmium efflux system outer membrane protein
MRPLLLASLAVVSVADAQPRTVTLDEAIALADKYGYDNLIADAARASAEGDVLAARALPNPLLGVGWAHEYNYVPEGIPPLGHCVGCAADGVQLTISDQGAVEATLSGKRALRRQIAELALRAASLSRDDVRRTHELFVKQQYVKAVAAAQQVVLALEIDKYASDVLALARTRYTATSTEGQLARVELDALQSDIDLRNARATASQEEAELRFLIGGQLPPLALDDSVLAFRIPKALVNASEPRLIALALSRRPDLAVLDAQADRAAHAAVLARRSLIPDVTLSLVYTAVGTAQEAVQPPQLLLAATFAFPVFYQHQGELRRAQADLRAARVELDKRTARLVTDVQTALSRLLAARDAVTVMETTQLETARRARDLVKAQWEVGSASLADYLDAAHTFVAVHRAHLDALVAYWTAVFQLEQAVAGDLRE